MTKRVIQLLTLAELHGYNLITIGRWEEVTGGSISGNGDIYGRVQGHRDYIDRNNKMPRVNGWPAIWDIAADVGFRALCGNSHQQQVEGITQEEPGVYIIPPVLLYPPPNPKLWGWMNADYFLAKTREGDDRMLATAIADKFRPKKLSDEDILYLISASVHKATERTPWRVIKDQKLYALPNLSGFFSKVTPFCIRRIYNAVEGYYK